MKTQRLFAVVSFCVPLIWLGCASSSKPKDDGFALRDLFQMTRADVGLLEAAMPKTGKKSLRLPKGRRALCTQERCTLSWSAKTIPLFAGDKKAATLAVEEGSAIFSRTDLRGIRALMDQAKKSGSRNFRRENQGQVRCYANLCTVDLAPMFALTAKESTSEVLQALFRSAALRATL